MTRLNERHGRLGILVATLLATGIAASTLGQSSGARPPRDDAPSQSDKSQDRAQKKREEREEKDRAKRYEKLDREDRAALDAVMGFEAPEFTATIDWIGDDGAPSLASLRGKVVVIQTFTTKSNATRLLPERVVKGLSEFKPEDVQVIAIHTPEGEEKADALLETMLEKSKLGIPVGVDRVGTFCDLIGAYRKPVNIVIDRTGDVRAGGLTPDGLAATVKEFVAETYDPANKPTKKPPATSESRKDFPVYKTAVRHAADLRGKQAPALGNVNWWNGQPRVDGQLLVVDFWATNCPACREALPHMNDLARAYPSDVVCIGLSDESSSNFDKGTKERDLKKSSFAFAVGVDPAGTMKRGFSISAIPHVAVISADGIVRWQGHPAELGPDVLKDLVDANRSLVSQRGDGGAGNRWKREAEAEPNKKQRAGKKS